MSPIVSNRLFTWSVCLVFLLHLPTQRREQHGLSFPGPGPEA